MMYFSSYTHCSWKALLKNVQIFFRFFHPKLVNTFHTNIFPISGKSRKEFPSFKNLILDIKSGSPLEPKTSFREFLAQEIKKIALVSNESLDKIREELKKSCYNVNDTNFNTILLEVCRLENQFRVGRDIFYLLYSHNRCNLATIGKFFRLCYDFSSECSSDDKSLLVKLSNELLEKYSILDSRTCENIVLGLSITNGWKEGLKLLEMCRLTSEPSTILYSALIEAAFFNSEPKIARNLLCQMVESNRPVHPDVYSAWMKFEGYEISTFNDILKFVEENNLHISEECAELFLFLFKKYDKIRHCAITTIHPTGKCRNCHTALKPVAVTEEEFLKLKKRFLDPVLVGKSIFLKTKPDEMSQFLSYLSKIGRVDVVLDGLNIAHSINQDRSMYSASFVLTQVVKHFIHLSKKVAVIGRKHMNNWPQNNMNYIRENSHLFLADNVSADDPFLLYTAMNSGLGTYFVSRDQMRSHKFLLKEVKLDNIFSRWQQKHQYSLRHVTPSGLVLLNDPKSYLKSPQESAPGVWHIPISTPLEGVPPHLVDSKTKWLCLAKT